MAAAQLTQELSTQGASSALANAPVNDISEMVKKKKKQAPTEPKPSPATSKRKLDAQQDVEMAPKKKQRMSAEADGAA